MADDAFNKLLGEFAADLLRTFPEIRDGIEPEVAAVAEGSVPSAALCSHVKQAVTPRFFEILYKSDSLFEDGEFVVFPGVDLAALWKEGISSGTRSAIWHYLQLLAFQASGSASDEGDLGDAAKLFEAVDPDELRAKLVEAVEEMKHAMPTSPEDVPDPEKLHDHFTGLLKGKLGCLASEIAEEAMRELNISEDADAGTAFSSLISNPTKLMALLRGLGAKLEQKIASGEIKESELYEEAGDLMSGMRNVPGMEGVQDMLRRLGGGGNTAAVEAELKRRAGLAKQKERMRDRLNARKAKSSQRPAASDLDPETYARLAEESERAARELLNDEVSGAPPAGPKKAKKSKKKRVK